MKSKEYNENFKITMQILTKKKRKEKRPKFRVGIPISEIAIMQQSCKFRAMILIHQMVNMHQSYTP